MSARLLLLAASVATLMFPNAARAGGYVAIGGGSDAKLHGDMTEHFSTEASSSGRIALGQRLGPLAIEAAFFGTDLRGTSAMVGDGDWSTLSLGVDLKYYLSLIGNLEAYARGGLNKTWMVSRPSDAMDVGHSGRGYSLGGGLQYTFRLLPVVDAAIWADYNHQVMRLHDDGRPSIEGAVRMVTVGVTLGMGI